MRTTSIVPALFLTLSFLGLILVAAFLNSPTAVQGNVSWREPLAGAVFSLVCVLGILAGIFPSRCSGMFHFRPARRWKRTEEPAELSEDVQAFRGHHPDCGSFKAHVVRVGTKVFCAGCAGLILGAASSLVGAAMHFFLQLSLQLNYSLVFWVGFVGVSCGLLQYHVFNWGRSSVHLFVNAFFVFGVFLLLVGVDAITQSTAADLYLIALSILWLYTRILLSQQDHRRICTACSVEECAFCGKKV